MSLLTLGAVSRRFAQLARAPLLWDSVALHAPVRCEEVAGSESWSFSLVNDDEDIGRAE